jgi:8-oxo-dGTP pyrophosphatase MutT (NUDIX family)
MTTFPDAPPPPLPDDLPVEERDAVRAVVMDRAGCVLLMRTKDPAIPEEGEWWELPGGGIEAGESYVDAVVRELAEETGLLVGPEAVGPALWTRTATFNRRRVARRLQHEVVVVVRLESEAPSLDMSGQLEHEKEEYLGWRWAAVPEIVASRERFYPGRLPELLPRLLAGDRVDEPFELWS